MSTQLGASQAVKAGILQATTAAAYTQQANGAECPLYDDSQPVKDWWDSTIPATVPDSSPIAYFYLGSDSKGNPGIQTMSTTAGVARNPNINQFGVFVSYAAYVASLPPTKATTSFVAPFASLAPQPLAVVNLSDLDTANRVASELTFDLALSTPATVQEIDQQSGEVYNYDPTDPRRVYNVTVNGQAYSLMRLLAIRFAQGVWCPGKWTLDPAEGPGFTAETFPSMPRNTTTLPLPIDPQYADSTKWQVIALFGGVLAIVPAGTQTPAPLAAGSDTPLAIDTNQKVTALYNLLPKGA